MMAEKQVRNVASVVIPSKAGLGDKRKFVLVRNDGKWGPPGGKLDGTDYDILTAATREVREETGLCVVLDNFIGIYTFESPNGNLVHNTAFSAIIESGEIRNRRVNEIAALDYFSLEEIRELSEKDELRSNPANVQVIEDYIRGEMYPISSIFRRIKTR